MGYKFGILLALFAGGLVTVAKPQQQANYELAEKFNAFDLGGKLSRNSLAIYPHEINGTDNFWFDFQTTDGKFYYYVTPANGKRELLFDNDEMAMALTELTRETIDPKDFSFHEFKFSKDQKSFTFEHRSKTYEYNRINRKLKEIRKTDDDKRMEGEVIYSWMNFSPDRKYILYAKNHNLYVKGNKALGMDTTEVQLTFDGMPYYTYARERDGFEPMRVGVKIAAMLTSFWKMNGNYVILG